MPDSTDLVHSTTRNGVTTLTMNLPERLNGWTMKLMLALRDTLKQAAEDPATKAVVLTGAGSYYSAGVNLAGTLKLAHPRKLREYIIEHNQALFDAFLDFPKPLLAAINGPALGAAATSSTLCDGIIVSEAASFSTPFAVVRVTPEGCSSVMFPRLLGEETAQRILGEEGWKPTGTEAHEIGLAQWLASPENLLDRAQEIAEGWVAEGRARTFRGGFSLDELKAANARESIGVADSFLGAPFLSNQARFLWRKKKRVPAAMFFILRATHAMWSRLL
jgi:enoyl-CoA hydratase/carnithine racemase